MRCNVNGFAISLVLWTRGQHWVIGLESSEQRQEEVNTEGKEKGIVEIGEGEREGVSRKKSRDSLVWDRTVY